jgi:tetratricopeptide (TPR) repeat protein
MSEFEIWNELGNIYYSTGAYDEAIRTYQKIIKLNPGCSQSYSNLASIFVCQGRYAEAIPMLQKGIELLDESFNKAFLWNQLGDAYRKLEDYAEASAAYRKAIELDPDNATFQEKLAEVEPASRIFPSDSLTDTNQEDLPLPKPDITELSFPGVEATGRIEPMLSRTGYKDDTETAPEMLSDLPDIIGSSETGNACWVFKDIEPALQARGNSSDAPEPSPVILGSRILSDTTVEVNALENPASLEEVKLSDQGMSKVSDKASSHDIEALDTLNLADNTSTIGQPEVGRSINASTHGLLRLGILHRRKGEYERALQFLKIALDAADRSQDHYLEALSYNVIALVETDLGKIEDAIQAYQSAANLAPERIFPWNNLGNLNCMLDRYDDAQASFQEAIEHNPKDSVGWNGLGDVYHKLGRNEDAIAAYQLGNVFEKHDIDEDALKEFEMTIDSNQENPHVWYEAGNIYSDTGAYDDAIASYRKAIELDPANATFQANLAKAEQALEQANAKSLPPTPEALTEINPEVLPKPEPLITRTASPKAEETNMAQPDSTGNEQAQEAKIIPEKLFSPPDRLADSDPESAYWIFKTVNPHGNTQQPAISYIPAVTETVVSGAKPLPAFAVQTRNMRAFSGGRVISDTNQDHTNILVQLTPRAVKPARMEAIINPPVPQHDRESASGEVDLELCEISSDAAEIRTDNSATQPIAAGNQATDQPSLNLQILEKDIAAYRRVTELNPKNDRAWDALGNMYETVGLHSEAIAAFEQAIALGPRKEAYHYHLGIAFAYQMHYDKAIQALQRVVALNPDYVLAHCALAGYYRRLGKEAEAQEHIKIARPSMESESEYNQACFESISGDADRAIALLEIALEKLQIQPAMVRSDPDLDFIRNDPRFEALLDKNRIICQ